MRSSRWVPARTAGGARGIDAVPRRRGLGRLALVRSALVRSGVAAAVAVAVIGLSGAAGAQAHKNSSHPLATPAPGALPARPAPGALPARPAPGALPARVARAASVAQAGAVVATRLPRAPAAKVAVPPSRSYVLVDVGTGKVLAGYQEHLRVPPASLTKILTALIAVTYLPADAGVPGTRQSWNAYPNTVGIEKGVSWPLKEVLHALLVYSANDAAYAIAQRVGGSLSAFGPVMDRSALQIGMSDDPVFHDPAGLDGPEGVDGGNLVSARDLAIAGRDLLHVPLLAAMVREESYDFVDPTGAPHDLPSMNFQFLDSYPGAIGIKTGFTDRAGDCIMAAATRHGRTMLAVVMNGYNPTETAIDLLNQGFATPAAAEPSGDHLPALALPSPPAPTRTMGGPVARPTKDARSIGRGPAASSGTKPAAAGARQGVATPRSSLRRPSATTARPATGPPNRSGLAAVVESWPAQALLVLAGLAALLALWELVSTNRVHRARQVKAGSNQAANTSVFATSRKRREQLIASYRRHERPAGFGRR